MEKWTKINKRGIEYIDFSGLLIASNSKDESIRIFFDKTHSGPVTISVQYSDISITFSEQNCVLYKSDKNPTIIPVNWQLWLTDNDVENPPMKESTNKKMVIKNSPP